MGRRIVAVTADLVADLPEPCRGCTFWEAGPGVGADPAVKSAWVASTTAAWGTCGQLATIDDVPAGYVLYAPPAYVPRAAAFATSPVTADAVLLMTSRVDADFAGQGLGRALVQSAAKDLTRRGFRAIEAYGSMTQGCVLPVAYLESVGFVTVRDHPVHPRMRLDLRTALSWRDPVGEALDRIRGAVRAFPQGASRV